ncbi:MAG: PDZ domain-containing protein, partial [Kofleriaceae bacterium]
IDGPYHVLVATRTIAGTDPVVDLGELHILKKRTQPGDPIGELGIQFAEQPPDTAPDQEQLKVSSIDPAGPAARTDLKVGDVITAIDGVDVTGAHTAQARPLLVAPPGTKIALALQRGATITLVLAAP